jgi:hypothetical protein
VVACVLCSVHFKRARIAGERSIAFDNSNAFVTQVPEYTIGYDVITDVSLEVKQQELRTVGIIRQR